MKSQKNSEGLRNQNRKFIKIYIIKDFLTLKDSKLVLFSNRRLFCNPNFQMYFQTTKLLNTFSPNTLTSTTPISFDPSIENFVDQFQMVIFYYLFPEEYKKRTFLLNLIKECNQKLKDIDNFLKNKWQKYSL